MQPISAISAFEVIEHILGQENNPKRENLQYYLQTDEKQKKSEKQKENQEQNPRIDNVE